MYLLKKVGHLTKEAKIYNGEKTISSANGTEKTEKLHVNQWRVKFRPHDKQLKKYLEPEKFLSRSQTTPIDNGPDSIHPHGDQPGKKKKFGM